MKELEVLPWDLNGLTITELVHFCEGVGLSIDKTFVVSDIIQQWSAVKLAYYEEDYDTQR